VCTGLRLSSPQPPDVEGADMADLAFITLTVVLFAAVALVARRLDRS
jgi:hypothetical protein